MGADRERIAFYISTLQMGGAERVISNLANGFCDKGWKVFMITENPDGKECYPLHPKVERVMLEAPENGSREDRGACKRGADIRTVEGLCGRTLCGFLMMFYAPGAG